MLEIRNLTKIYKSKTGDSVKALDDVSIAFPESGMVFILGKSGSGKSTLLNVMGGLDGYDSGEFIIKGKSSKDFGGSDFDAYRNTFIGFIFQEYNILDDFTVGANIGLALELQGKKATNEKINGILSQVDLLNYAKRKPNELSGGQKQRVAIARALVKEPQIIMADEPTGALDSNTGKQIFDTLKELSKEKLVLIVSHDRDFAEKYADRIVELCDGKIISDVTKHEKKSEQLSEGIQKINDNLLRIKGGYRLTANDLQMINEYLSTNHNDIILSSDGRINDELRSAVGISADGNTSIFEGTNSETDYKLKSYKKEDSKFIRSKLPAKNALRIGSSGLKHKKFRLVMTIFLSLIAFALFGFADTLGAYDKVTSAVDSIMDSNITSASVTLGVRRTYTYNNGNVDTYFSEDLMNDEDIENLKQSTGLNFVPVYNGGQLWGGGFSVANMCKQYQQNNVYTGRLSGVVSMDEAAVNSAGYAVAGSLPKESGEIAITELVYKQFNEFGFVNSEFDEKVDAKSLTTDPNGADNSIIGKHLTLSTNVGMPTSYKIVGVINTNFDYERYQSFMPQDASQPSVQQDAGIAEMVLLDELSGELNYGMHQLGFMTNDDIVALSKTSINQYKEIFTYMNSWGNTSLNVKISPVEAFIESIDDKENIDSFYSQSYYSIANDSILGDLDVIWLGDTPMTKLDDNHILIPESYVNRFVPYDAYIPVNAADIENMLRDLVGAERWNAVDKAKHNQFIDVFAEAYMYSYADQVFADNGSALTAAVSEYACYGYDLSLDEAKEYFVNFYINNYSELPVYNYAGELKFPYEVRSEAENIAYDTLVPYYADLLKIDLSEIDDAELLDSLKYTIIYTFSDVVIGYEGSVFVPNYRISDILRTIDAHNTVKQNALWNNEDFYAKIIASNYIDESSWDNLDDDGKKNAAISFYYDTYLYNSEWGGYYENEFGGMTYQEIEAQSSQIIRNISGFSVESLAELFKIEMTEYDYQYGTEASKYQYDDLQIVGFIKPGNYNEGVVSNRIYNDYTEWYKASMADNDWGYTEEKASHTSGIWTFAVAPLIKDRAIIQNLVEMSYNENVDIQFTLKNAVMNTLYNFNDFIEIGATVFLWIGVGFAVFSALLLMNFISTSISYKKREIGVLRAVGARSSDVFKIFFSEALIIALINFIFATAVVIAGVIFTNTWMQSQGINITLLHFGVRQIALMMLVSVFVALVSSFLPVYNIAKRKPIDAIRDK